MADDGRGRRILRPSFAVDPRARALSCAVWLLSMAPHVRTLPMHPTERSAQPSPHASSRRARARWSRLCCCCCCSLSLCGTHDRPPHRSLCPLSRPSHTEIARLGEPDLARSASGARAQATPKKRGWEPSHHRSGHSRCHAHFRARAVHLRPRSPSLSRPGQLSDPFWTRSRPLDCRGSVRRGRPRALGGREKIAGRGRKWGDLCAVFPLFSECKRLLASRRFGNGPTGRRDDRTGQTPFRLRSLDSSPHQPHCSRRHKSRPSFSPRFRGPVVHFSASALNASSTKKK